ncbi:MAG: YihY/virulence factor BrkB family protein [bacterium]|nr:YihY/virulence factor BrkB family protein [bacterium]
MKNALTSFSRNGCLNMAAATAFYALLSTIPIIFVIVSAAGFFFEGSKEIILAVIKATDTLFPSLVEVIQREVLAVISKKGLIGGTGIIIMLWSSTLVFSSLEFSFSRIFDIEKRRSFLKSKLVSTGFLILGGVVLAASILLTTAAKIAQSKFLAPYDIKAIHFFSTSIFLPYILPVLLLTLLFAVIYTVLSRRQVSPKEGLAGGLICATMFESAKHLFAWYIANLGRHSVIYGSLGAMVVVILWFFYASVIILFCGELIAAWKRENQIRT